MRTSWPVMLQSMISAAVKFTMLISQQALKPRVMHLRFQQPPHAALPLMCTNSDEMIEAAPRMYGMENPNVDSVAGRGAPDTKLSTGHGSVRTAYHSDKSAGPAMLSLDVRG